MFLGLNDVAFLAAVAGGAALDEAAAYIAAVEAADNQALEPAVRAAINDFVVGCKDDGIWNAIKASCILAGARTLNGALVPLVGAAPTNFNFVEGDYNRKTGLVGNGSSKYLDSGASPLSSGSLNNGIHAATYDTETNSNFNFRAYMQGDNFPVFNQLGHRATSEGTLSFAVGSIANGNNQTGLKGSSWLSGTVNYRSDTLAGTSSASITSLSEGNYFIFARRNTLGSFGNARLAFYSIGESLDLALLDARVTDLINAFDAAI
jgi:hypothetical protein